MNWNLVGKTVKDRWRSTVIYAAALAAYTLMMTAIFPTFKNISGLEEIMEQYPEDLFRLFGGAEFDFTNFNNYITVEFLGLIFIVIVGAYVFTFARSMVAGEIKDGTMELLLSQPVERWQVLTSKGLVMVAGFTGLVLVVILSIIAFGSAFNVGVTYSSYLAFLPLAITMFIAIAGYSILLTVIVPRWGTMAAVGVTLAFYLLNFAAETVASISWLKYLSIFYYYNVNSVLSGGGVPVVNILVLAGLGLACFAVALYLFQRMDIKLPG